MNSQKVFTDDGTHILQFLAAYDVVCPNCQAKAHVRVIEKSAWLLFAPRALSCSHCGYNKEWRETGVTSHFKDDPVDWYFGATFWHRKPCCGHVLWVANKEHLAFLRNYISAKIRSHVKTASGWSNQSLSSRLPRWMTSSRNRNAVLKALDSVEKDLEADF